MEQLQTVFSGTLENTCSELLIFSRSLHYNALLTVTVDHTDTFLIKLEGNIGPHNEPSSATPFQQHTDVDTVKTAVEAALLTACLESSDSGMIQLQGLLCIILDSKYIMMITVNKTNNELVNYEITEDAHDVLDTTPVVTSLVKMEDIGEEGNTACDLLLSLDVDTDDVSSDNKVKTLDEDPNHVASERSHGTRRSARRRTQNIRFKEYCDNHNEERNKNNKANMSKSADSEKCDKSICKDSEDTSKIYKCKDCNQTFSCNKDCLQHQKSAHSVKGPFTCELCDKVYQKSTNLEKHKKLHGKLFKCDECNKEFQKQKYLTEHKHLHSDKKFTCDVCHQLYNSYNALRRHRKVHDQQVHACDQCDKTFDLAMKLTAHKRVHGTKHFTCEFCGHGFSQKGNLICHRRIHTDEKPFVCGYCPKQFRTISRQKIHEMTHTGVRPHVCQVCNKAFRTSTKLKDHKRIHSGLKPFSCEHCSRSFAIRSNMIKHRNIHTGHPHRCEGCGKGFGRVNYLETHQRICNQKTESLNNYQSEQGGFQEEIDIKLVLSSSMMNIGL